jgi:hypothetical protein
MHTNSIDYNEEFDQILISVCNFNEIWVIDHSTTTEEEAGHTGGISGKGGDILYRWGNPQTYDEGTSIDQKLFMQHDATWINKGYPGEGNILVFNNGKNRPDGNYSSVDEIIPPVNDIGEYYIADGKAYGPETQIWIYSDNPNTSFYSDYLGGAHRLASGNTLITIETSGKLFEVTPDKTTVWQYNTGGSLFKAVYIPPEEQEPGEPNLDCEGSLYWVNVDAGVSLNGNFFVKNIGDNYSILNWKITSFPDWCTWYFNPDFGEGLKPENGSVTVKVSIISPNEKNKDFNGFIRVENQNDSEDFDVIPVYVKTPKQRTINQPFFNYLESHLNTPSF